MILIAESGSTKTDWRYKTQNNEIISFSSEGLNPYYLTSEQIAKYIKPIFDQFQIQNIQKIHFYGTGVTHPDKGAIVEKGLKLALSDEVVVETHSDVVAAAHALYYQSEGVVCILGTGSNSCHWVNDRIAYQVPPLGFWLGDEGSGGHLGKSLILSYLHNELPQKIRDKFIKSYGALTRIDILDKAYYIDKPNAYFARYTYFLKDNLDDLFIKSLVCDSFNQFISKYLLKYPEIKNLPLGFVGTIAHVFRTPLENTLLKNDLKINRLIEKPIDALINVHQ